MASMSTFIYQGIGIFTLIGTDETTVLVSEGQWAMTVHLAIVLYTPSPHITEEMVRKVGKIYGRLGPYRKLSDGQYILDVDSQGPLVNANSFLHAFAHKFTERLLVAISQAA